MIRPFLARTDASPGGRSRGRGPAMSLLLLASLLATACGGSEPPASQDVPVPETPPAREAAPSSSAPETASPAAAAPVPAPVIRFAAHGPAPRTYGPRCGDGIEGTSSDVFRITAPDDWLQRGTGGGSGPDHISFEVAGSRSRVVVDLYASREELDYQNDFEDRGPTGLTVDVAGTSVPLHEVAVEDRTGYGILHLPWLLEVPRLGEIEGSVLVTSRGPGLMTSEGAASVLGTVRVERCSGISQLLVWGPASGRLLLPEFEGGDPLGKERPDDPQPAYVPGQSPLLAYSEAQLAYLLPLEAEVARCVAPLVREDAGDDPILHLKVLAPSGTMKETLAAYAARCEE